MGKAATKVVHDDGTVYILILNADLLFGKLMDHSIINPNQISSFVTPVSEDSFDRTPEFGIDHRELFIPFKTEGTPVLFGNYVPSEHELETCSRIVLTYGEVEWDPENVTTERNMPYGDKYCFS